MQKVVRRLCVAKDDLFLNRVDVRELTLSSVLSRDVSSYKQPNLAHLHVVRRLAERGDELPHVGDRISYVIVAPKTTAKGIPNYELAEDPAYVAQHQIPMHAEKYFDQTVKAVANLIAPIFPKGECKKEKFLMSILPHRVYLDASFKEISDTV